MNAISELFLFYLVVNIEIVFFSLKSYNGLCGGFACFIDQYTLYDHCNMFLFVIFI